MGTSSYILGDPRPFFVPSLDLPAPALLPDPPNSRFPMLRCPECRQTTLDTLPDRIELLKRSGKLLKDKKPDPAIVHELLMLQLPSVVCDRCGHSGLEWREVLPETRQCTACSAAGRTGQADDREFCPKCGSEMKLVLRSGRGLTGYSMRCKSCGWF